MKISDTYAAAVAEQDEKKSRSTSVDLAGNAATANRRLTTFVLKKYLASNPERNTLKQQITVLRAKIKTYKSQGNHEAQEQCEVILLELTQKVKDFDRAVIGRNKEDIEKYNTAINNDPEIKSLKKEIKAVRDEMKENDVKSLLSQMRTLRRELKFKLTPEEYEDFDFVVDLDVEYNPNSLTNQYIAVMVKLSEITGYSPTELHSMPANRVKSIIEENAENNEIESETLNLRLMELNGMLEARKRVITGSNDLTAILMADKKSHPEVSEQEHYRKSKNIIASSYVKYVENAAYRICSKLNLLHEFAEAISIGYEALAKAINNWEKAQRETEVPISFEVFLNKSISMYIERGLLDVTGNGTISGSLRADKYSRENAYIRKRMSELRAELGDTLPDDYLMSIIRNELGDTYSQGSVTTESDFVSIVGGDSADSDSNDIWSNIVADSNSDDASDILQSKEYYNQLFEALKKLFTVKKKVINKRTGKQEVTTDKIFKPEDQLLFTLAYGLKMKQLPDGTERMYTQKEMAEELMKYNESKGIHKTMSQSAVSTALGALKEKVALALDQNPGLKQQLRLIYDHYKLHSNTMEMIAYEEEESDVDA